MANEVRVLPGARVVLSGLNARADLNDNAGIVTGESLSARGGRFPVRLDDGVEVALKLDNLSLVSAPRAKVDRQCATCGAIGAAEGEHKFSACGACLAAQLIPTFYCSRACQKLHWKTSHKEWHRQQKENAACPPAMAGAKLSKAKWETRTPTGVESLVADIRTIFPSATDDEIEKRVQCLQLQEKGLTHMHDKKYGKATKTFRQAIAVWPSEPRSYYNLALVQLRSNDLLGATEHFLKATACVETQGDHVEAPVAAEIYQSAFSALHECLCKPALQAAAKALKPVWWNEESLLTISATVVGVLPANPKAWEMRAYVVGGMGAETWGASSVRSAAHNREAAMAFKKQAALDPSKAARCSEAAANLMRDAKRSTS